MHTHVLMTYYIKYLKSIRRVSDSTVRHYQEALRYISKYLVSKGLLNETVYEITDIGELEVIREYLKSDKDFKDLDKRGHQMYSAGFNNYCKFANGEGFANIHDKIVLMDEEIEAPHKSEITVGVWKRSSIIKVQSLEAAGFECEVDSRHITFTSKSTGRPYMEGHHALALKYQDKFSKNLDVYANVVCLCPLCHRLLHYGVSSEKEYALNKIYHDRVDRLAKSGIRISKEDFDKMII